MRHQTHAVSESGALKVLAWFGVALQGAALIAVVLVQRWGGLPSIGIFLVLSVAFLLMEDGVPGLISFLVVVAAIVNAGGWAWEWYALVWFDEFVHFFTSMVVVAALVCMAWGHGWLSRPEGYGRAILVAAAIALGLGVLWEIAEALFVSLTVVDTMFDLILDTLGGAAGGWLAKWVVQEHQQHRAGRA